jgi:hypothetical protein
VIYKNSADSRAARPVKKASAPIRSWSAVCEDTGAVQVTIMGLVVVSPNTSLWEHWTKKNTRSKRQGAIVLKALAPCVQPALPLTVTMTRVSPRELDDDNLCGAFKKVRDSIAEWLGVDDRDKRITWRTEQRKAPKDEAGTVIRFEQRIALPAHPADPLVNGLAKAVGIWNVKRIGRSGT